MYAGQGSIGAAIALAYLVEGIAEHIEKASS